MRSTANVKVAWTWREWRQSRAARRAAAEQIGPDVVRRKESSSDRRLRSAFGGERGPAFNYKEIANANV